MQTLRIAWVSLASMSRKEWKKKGSLQEFLSWVNKLCNPQILSEFKLGFLPCRRNQKRLNELLSQVRYIVIALLRVGVRVLKLPWGYIVHRLHVVVTQERGHPCQSTEERDSGNDGGRNAGLNLGSELLRVCCSNKCKILYSRKHARYQSTQLVCDMRKRISLSKSILGSVEASWLVMVDFLYRDHALVR